MKAISIRQPWAWLIIHAGKNIENRTWRTDIRGRVLIHAAKGMTRIEYDDAFDVAAEIIGMGIKMPDFEKLERGGIVGAVEIVDCLSFHTSPWFFGKWGFVLKNPEPLPFRPMRGQLGFFDVEAT
jgi:hypothetical protein